MIGRMLASASSEFINALRTPVRTSSDLMKAAGVNKDIAGRFLTAVGKRDPLAVVYYMPGVDSLRRLSRGARARAADPAGIQTFEDAIAAFENFLQGRLGGRHALDAMASAWLPEARDRFESASRQLAYRAAANLRGVESEAMVDTIILHPGADPDRLDAVLVHGVIGVRRLRPVVPLPIATFDHRGDTAGHPALSLEGRSVVGDGAPDEYLPEFSRGDPSDVRVVRSGSTTTYELVGAALGVGAAGDVFFGQCTPALFRRWAKGEGDVASHAVNAEIPSQRLVMDVLLHPDAWPKRDPELIMYNTCVRGLALVQDSSRDADRMDLLDSVRQVGTGVDCCRVAEVPQYTELLQWACERRGWDPGCFRVYRCDSKYPVFGVQYTMAFRLEGKL